MFQLKSISIFLLGFLPMISLGSELSCDDALPQVRLEDKIRIAEALAIRNTVGESVWNGVTKPPFAILLVTEAFEYLFYHPYPSSDFTFLEKDSITSAEIYYRNTTYPTYFQAAFPAVSGVSCVVIGTPEATQSSNSTEWVLTVLHENFHQYQDYQPYAFAAVNELNLANGDDSGMWQINYPFPYSDENVKKAYSSYSKALWVAIESLEKEGFQQAFQQYKIARDTFYSSLSSADAKYFTFQLWKEGIARYTEYAYLNEIQTVPVSSRFKNLSDFVPFKELSISFLHTELVNLKSLTLEEGKREVVYSLGLAEGYLWDAVAPRWKQYYFTDKFELTSIFKATKRPLYGTSNK